MIELVTAFEIGSVSETVVAVVHLVHFILSPITTYPTVQPSSIFVSLSNPVPLVMFFLLFCLPCLGLGIKASSL